MYGKARWTRAGGRLEAVWARAHALGRTAPGTDLDQDVNLTHICSDLFELLEPTARHRRIRQRRVSLRFASILLAGTCHVYRNHATSLLTDCSAMEMELQGLQSENLEMADESDDISDDVGDIDEIRQANHSGDLEISRDVSDISKTSSLTECRISETYSMQECTSNVETTKEHYTCDITDNPSETGHLSYVEDSVNKSLRASSVKKQYRSKITYSESRRSSPNIHLNFRPSTMVENSENENNISRSRSSPEKCDKTKYSQQTSTYRSSHEPMKHPERSTSPILRNLSNLHSSQRQTDISQIRSSQETCGEESTSNIHRHVQHPLPCESPKQLTEFPMISHRSHSLPDTTGRTSVFVGTRSPPKPENDLVSSVQVVPRSPILLFRRGITAIEHVGGVLSVENRIISDMDSSRATSIPNVRAHKLSIIDVTKPTFQESEEIESEQNLNEANRGNNEVVMDYDDSNITLRRIFSRHLVPYSSTDVSVTHSSIRPISPRDASHETIRIVTEDPQRTVDLESTNTLSPTPTVGDASTSKAPTASLPPGVRGLCTAPRSKTYRGIRTTRIKRKRKDTAYRPGKCQPTMLKSPMALRRRSTGDSIPQEDPQQSTGNPWPINEEQDLPTTPLRQLFEPLDSSTPSARRKRTASTHQILTPTEDVQQIERSIEDEISSPYMRTPPTRINLDENEYALPSVSCKRRKLSTTLSRGLFEKPINQPAILEDPPNDAVNESTQFAETELEEADTSNIRFQTNITCMSPTFYNNFEVICHDQITTSKDKTTNQAISTSPILQLNFSRLYRSAPPTIEHDGPDSTMRDDESRCQEIVKICEPEVIASVANQQIDMMSNSSIIRPRDIVPSVECRNTSSPNNRLENDDSIGNSTSALDNSAKTSNERDQNQSYENVSSQNTDQSSTSSNKQIEETSQIEDTFNTEDDESEMYEGSAEESYTEEEQSERPQDEMVITSESYEHRRWPRLSTILERSEINEESIRSDVVEQINDHEEKTTITCVQDPRWRNLSNIVKRTEGNDILESTENSQRNHYSIVRGNHKADTTFARNECASLGCSRIISTEGEDTSSVTSQNTGLNIELRVTKKGCSRPMEALIVFCSEHVLKSHLRNDLRNRFDLDSIDSSSD